MPFLKHSIEANTLRLAEITKHCLRQKKISRINKCFAIAEKHLTEGNTAIKNAISNIFLFSVSTFIEIQHQYKVTQLLPENLLAEYHKQINTSGI
ncbi:hypothetical protein KJK34_02000 [Flavobacterium sp. D11R37]|uniref:DUF7674 family protein n=1 Tax=Flavobacterium coralii TaxID=2838017 RepID=UPI001CA76D85|nr:hypothetical protein [Flavobacterium coralii]MBY8961515.1 hypothetical protein [Flavobacterium coralii]